VGTSLTAGLGLDPSEAYPAVLQQKIDSAGLNYRVVNRGVSGETSAGARQRVDWLMQQQVAVLILETGANDGLRGLDPDSVLANIEAIVRRARQQRPPPGILLIGMEAPPNLGANYTTRFRAVYREAAATLDVPLVPFLLEGVGGIDSLNQADGIHPTAEGQRRIADLVWKALLPLLRSPPLP
jgi:acyl-CoA thioesterase-1